jgi:2-keto-3-deoxy-L-rhamnonate aldolase RhmA
MKITFQHLLQETKPVIGTFIQSGSPEFLEAAAYAGFRFAAVDLEHAYYGVDKTAELIRAGEAADLCMLVRVPALDRIWIKKSLDLGASGIVIPNIDIPEQAAEAVASCHFAPAGLRGACPAVRANRYGAGGKEYYSDSDRNVAVIPLVESRMGVRNFDSIVRTPGISGIFFGPVDLSVELGLEGQAEDPAVQDVLADLAAKAVKANVPCGSLVLSPESARRMAEQGCSFLGYGIDTILMYQKCREIMDSLQ